MRARVSIYLLAAGCIEEEVEKNKNRLAGWIEMLTLLKLCRRQAGAAQDRYHHIHGCKRSGTLFWFRPICYICYNDG